MITHHGRINSLSASFTLDEAERFTIPYEHGYTKSSEDGTPLLVDTIRASVDLFDGSVELIASGYLINKNGTVGERYRQSELKIEDTPLAIRNAVVIEWRAAVRKITSVKGVTF